MNKIKVKILELRASFNFLFFTLPLLFLHELFHLIFILIFYRKFPKIVINTNYIDYNFEITCTLELNIFNCNKKWQNYIVRWSPILSIIIPLVIGIFQPYVFLFVIYQLIYCIRFKNNKIFLERPFFYPSRMDLHDIHWIEIRRKDIKELLKNKKSIDKYNNKTLKFIGLENLIK
jgi:hypothetical protein